MLRHLKRLTANNLRGGQCPPYKTADANDGNGFTLVWDNRRINGINDGWMVALFRFKVKLENIYNGAVSIDEYDMWHVYDFSANDWGKVGRNLHVAMPPWKTFTGDENEEKNKN